MLEQEVRRRVSTGFAGRAQLACSEKRDAVDQVMLNCVRPLFWQGDASVESPLRHDAKTSEPVRIGGVD